MFTIQLKLWQFLNDPFFLCDPFILTESIIILLFPYAAYSLVLYVNI